MAVKQKKRYYWLKLRKDFFDQKEIKMLRKIAGGDTFTIIYLKMLLKSLENNGVLYFESIGKDFAEEVAIDIDEDTENVKVTLSFLQSKGLLEIGEEDEFLLSKVPEMVGSEAFSTERSRRSRAKKKNGNDIKVLHCNTDATLLQHDATKRIEKREKREEKREKKIESRKEKKLDISVENMYYETIFFKDEFIQKDLESLKEFQKTMSIEVIALAFKIVKENNKTNGFAYCKKILDNFKDHSIYKINDTLQKEQYGYFKTIYDYYYAERCSKYDITLDEFIVLKQWGTVEKAMLLGILKEKEQQISF